MGRSLFPVDVHSGFDEGMWAPLPTLRAIAPPTNAKTGAGPSPTYMVRWAKDTRSDARVAALKQRFSDAEDISPAQIPPELTNLRNVRTVPAVPAAFLVLLGLASLVHVLVASVRARRRDFAVLRAIGFTRRMNAEVVVVHSAVVALVGLIVGIPVGSAIGRAGWSWVSARVPMVFASPLWLQLVAVIIPLALVAAVAIAAWPARRAGRLQPAVVLRGE